MFRKLKQYRKERKWAMYAAVLFSVLVSLFLVVLLLFKMASLGAAGIFNYAVSKQKMLRDDHGRGNHSEYPWRRDVHEPCLG